VAAFVSVPETDKPQRLRPHEELQRVRAVWPQVLGDYARDTVLVGLSPRGQVALAARTPELAQRLSRESDRVVQDINQALGEDAVGRIQPF
jgi:hypothetical protein